MTVSSGCAEGGGHHGNTRRPCGARGRRRGTGAVTGILGRLRTGAALCGDPHSLASALQKLEATAARVPMDIDPAHAQAFIVNPLTGRRMSFANLWRSHPPTEDRVARLTSVSHS